MDINIVERDERQNYIINVGGKFTLTTTVIGGYHPYGPYEPYPANEATPAEWIREISKIYGRKKKATVKNIIVGLHGDRKIHYSRPGWQSQRILKDKDEPFDVLVLCVGYHCLIYHDYEAKYVRALDQFFGDRRNIFVGVGIHKTADKIEKFSAGFWYEGYWRWSTKRTLIEDNRTVVQSRVELRELAAQKGYSAKANNDDDDNKDGRGERCDDAEENLVKRDELNLMFRRYSLPELAKMVLGEEMKFVKPKNIEWGREDFTMYATVEAFLTWQIGAKLLTNWRF